MSPRSSRRRGRATGPTLTTIWWRDIPVQVLATGPAGDDAGAVRPVRAELPARFGHAVDRAAMAAGLAGTDAYLEQWDRRSRSCGPDLDAEVAAEVERLVAAHPRDVLAALVANDARTPGAVDATPGVVDGTHDPDTTSDPRPQPERPRPTNEVPT